MAMTNGVAKQRPKLHPRMFTRANLAMYVAVGMVFWQQEAHASSLSSGGGGLPWDSALTTLATSSRISAGSSSGWVPWFMLSSQIQCLNTLAPMAE